MGERDILERIRGEIDKIKVIDTHEHIIRQTDLKKLEVDLFDLLKNSYVRCDLTSSGMGEEEWQRRDYDPEEGWKRIKPYLDNVRNTTYYRSLLRALGELYDFKDEEINEGNWRNLSERINRSNKRDDWYGYVLKEKGNIDLALLDIQYPLEARATEIEREFFVPVYRMDHFIMGHIKYNRFVLEKEYGPLRSLESFLEKVDRAFKKGLERGMVGIKSGLAYHRTLNYERVDRSEAERIFNLSTSDYYRTLNYIKVERPEFQRIQALSTSSLSALEAKKFQDYVMHVVIEKTIEYGLPFQIHTGLQSENGNVLVNSNPLLLTNLFLEYPEAKFDLFHGGYPFTGELAVLAKNFPNVYIDLCWLSIISPSLMERALEEWIETVPGNKILAWGGDCRRVEGSYGSLLYAKEVVSKVLARKVEEGYFGEGEAIGLARKVFRENILKLYKLPL